MQVLRKPQGFSRAVLEFLQRFDQQETDEVLLTLVFAVDMFPTTIDVVHERWTAGERLEQRVHIACVA